MPRPRESRGRERRDGGESVDYDIEIKDVEPQPIVSIRQETTPAGLGAAFRELLPVVHEYLQKRGVEPSGPSFGIYHVYETERVDFEAGFPVAEPVEGEGRIEAGEFPGGRAAVVVHEGPYDTIGAAHEALDAFVHERGTHGGSPREVYRTGPGDESDASKWRTEVIYPLD
jgi:AraC family transcriptional regulator